MKLYLIKNDVLFMNLELKIDFERTMFTCYEYSSTSMARQIDIKII